MYLREVTLNGFKSFADITPLPLQPGVTAIVGPNGCGKSNLSEAIRWVLGEQSAKSLRGATMQDIIFGGSDRRKPLPYAEVVLTFSDCEKELGSGFHEVQVSRRVSRDGSSQYRINGKNSRLKDIQRLFMDTGVGQVAYSFLVQGQVDQILSSNPADRRAIFEEAAGITRYKSQRREALNKLTLVDNNLARVSDVIDEVSRQIGTLKRQASKAVRYKRLHHRQTHLDLGWSAYQIQHLEEQIADLEKEEESLRTKIATLRTRLESQEASLVGDREERARILLSVEALQEEIFELRSSVENAESQSRMLAERTSDFVLRVSKLEEEEKQFHQQKTALSEQSENESQTRQTQLDLLGDSDEQAKMKQSAFEAAALRLSEVEQSYRDGRNALVNLENAITRLRSRCTGLEVDLKSYQVRHASLGENVHRAREEETRLAEQIAKIEKLSTTKGKELEDLEQSFILKRDELQQVRDAYREAQSHIQELDRQLARTTARRQILQDLQDRMEGYGEGAKALLNGKLGEPYTAERMSLLSKLIEVPNDYTSAAEALLGTAVDAIYWKDTNDLKSLLEEIRGKNIARTALIYAGERTPPPASESPKNWTPAGTIIQAKEATFQPVLDALLEGCFFVETDEEFFSSSQSKASPDYQWVASREGSVFGRNGLILAGRTLEGKKSLLGREAEIRRIRSEISEMEKELDSQRERITADQEKMGQLEKDLEETRNLRDEIKQETSSLAAELRSLTSAREENGKSLEQAQRQLQELESSRDKSEQALQEANHELQTAETSIEEKKKELSEAEKSLEELRQERDHKREEWTNTRLDLASRKQALELVEKGLGEIERRSREIELAIAGRQQEIRQLKERIENAQREREEQEEIQSVSGEELTEKKNALQEERTKLQGVEKRLEEEEQKMSGERRELQELEQTLNRKEVERTKLQSRADFIVEKCETENQLDVHTLNWRKSIWEADIDLKGKVNLDDLDDGEEVDLEPIVRREDPTEEELGKVEEPDWSEVESEVKQLRERIASMGAINLVAIEEYRELRERHEFLRSQSQDLWNSKEELVRAIDEINETSQSLFQDTFEKIRTNFQYTYGHLTGGGESDLALIDAEDVLDSGIEIKARPPGVRKNTLSLLSGGQRTMAAVALLFAIYRVKPSPFCVLDELDAPLDDANIGRFTEMLREFTAFSQFLIITHNKRTIAASDSVFGVTMQEKGVSRLVSMRFNHKTKKAEFAEGEREGEVLRID